MLTIRELIKTLYNAFIQKLKKHRGNWEQNDPAADDYIKNRPFYTDGQTSVIKNTTFKTYYEGEQCLPFVFKPIIGEIYKVIWDGKEYECITYLDSYRAVCIGNYYLAGGTKDTGEPFYYYYDKNYEDFGLYVKNAGAHTISIDKLNVKKIDKKFVDMSDTVSQDMLARVAFSGGYWDLIGTPTIYTDVIRYNSTQSLTSTQKTKTRTNIGAVGYESQSLTTAQKTQARTNIGAASTDEFTTRLGRSTAVNVADTNYTTYMARGTSLNSTDTNPTVNGTIAWTYE